MFIFTDISKWWNLSKISSFGKLCCDIQNIYLSIYIFWCINLLGIFGSFLLYFKSNNTEKRGDGASASYLDKGKGPATDSAR